MRERVMAVAVGDNLSAKVLVPIQDMFKDDYRTNVSIVGSSRLVYSAIDVRAGGVYLRTIEDIISRLHLDIVSGFYNLDLSNPETINDHTGSPAVFLSYAFSQDGMKIVGVLRDYLIISDFNAHTTEMIARKTFTAAYMWPAPSFSPFISNDGATVGYVGSNTREYILHVTSECIGLPIKEPTIYDSELYTNCAHREITSKLNEYSTPTNAGIYMRTSAKLQQADTTIRYQENSTGDWHQISYENFTGERYMALGDSYASGEGDMDELGNLRYLPGTNEKGDYPNGVPREMCHLSERAYPFLLANQGGLQRGVDMNSVACSGALRINIAKTPLDTSVHNEYVNGVYLGQMADRDDGKKPRLEGIANSAVLQQDAMDMMLPGRVQQIEQLKAKQPYAATVQISGNDLGFGPIIIACVFNWPGTSYGKESPDTPGDCEWSSPEFRAKIAAAILGNRTELVKLYRQLHSVSPNTQLYAVGYPIFVKQTAVCMNALSLSAAETEFINEAVKFTNVTIKSAASEAGIRYIDIEDAIGDQSICGKNGAMTDPLDMISAAIMADKKRGMKADEIIQKYHIYGPAEKAFVTALYKAGPDSIAFAGIAASPYFSYLAFSQQLFHPNAEGHRLIANKIANALGNESIVSAQCDEKVIFCPRANGAVPTVPTYFGSNLTATGLQVELASIVFKNTTSQLGTAIDAAYTDGMWVIRTGKEFIVRLTPKAFIQGPVGVLLHSTPVKLGEMTKTAEGVYEGKLTIPSDTVIGMHIIEVSGKTVSGEDYSSLAPIAVIGSPDDEDGDRVIDVNDACLYAPTCLQQPSIGSPLDITSGLPVRNLIDTQVGSGELLRSALWSAEARNIGVLYLNGSTNNAKNPNINLDPNSADTAADSSAHSKDGDDISIWVIPAALLFLLLLVLTLFRRKNDNKNKNKNKTYSSDGNPVA